tara:strand:- start:781 stop:1119 length:339 start_codon:yes stop_codon:yes gene_type:complete
MAAAKHDIVIEKRAIFELPLTLSDDAGDPYSLTGIFLTGQVRRDYDNALQATFHYEVLDSGTASVKMSLDSDVTANIEKSYCSYDIFLDTVGADSSQRVIYGVATISGNVTQ